MRFTFLREDALREEEDFLREEFHFDDALRLAARAEVDFLREVDFLLELRLLSSPLATSSSLKRR